MRCYVRIFIILTALFFSACKKDNFDSNSIIGKWELNNHNVVTNGRLGYNIDYEKGKSFIYHFNSNNTYTLYNADSIFVTGTYRLDSNKLSLNGTVRPGYYVSDTHNYLIDGKTLALFNNGRDMAGEWIETFIYTRISNR